MPKPPSQVFRKDVRVLHQGRPAVVISVKQKEQGTSSSAQQGTESVQLYLHHDGDDPRLCDWFDSSTCTLIADQAKGTRQKRRRSVSPLPANGQYNEPTAPRRIGKVRTQYCESNCWYDSPYQIDELWAEQTALDANAARRRALDLPPAPVPKSARSQPSSTVLPFNLPAIANGSVSKSKARTKERPADDSDALPVLEIFHPMTAFSNPDRDSALGEAELKRSRSNKTKASKKLESLVINVPTSQGSAKHPPLPSVRTPSAPTGLTLYVCDYCLNYTISEMAFAHHAIQCQERHPPGRMVYNDTGKSIWEVDGAEQKIYCHNLALFGKLFIDHKYVCFDVHNFLFYIITENTPSAAQIVGFFSKEKDSRDHYNLACIIVLPWWQGKSYGAMMIEMSYELSKRSPSPIAGTPERPLSDLGEKSYLHYWLGTIVRHLRQYYPKDGAPPPDPIPMTIAELAAACCIRPEDVAFTLEHRGLASKKRSSDDGILEFVLTPALIEAVAKEWKVKRKIIDDQYLLLDD